MNIKWLRRLEISRRAVHDARGNVEIHRSAAERQGGAVLVRDGGEVRHHLARPAKWCSTVRAFYEITGLAWSGRGAIKRVDVSADGGKTWRQAALQGPVLPICHTRFRMPWKWDGKEADAAEPLRRRYRLRPADARTGDRRCAGSTARSVPSTTSTRSKAGRSRPTERFPMSTTTERVLGAMRGGACCRAASVAADGDRLRLRVRRHAIAGPSSTKFFSPLPDGRGLPPGSGTVEQGKAVYQQQCVACHGANLQGGIGDRLIGGRGTPGQQRSDQGAGQDHRELLAVRDDDVRLCEARDAVRRARQPYQRSGVRGDRVHSVARRRSFRRTRS